MKIKTIFIVLLVVVSMTTILSSCNYRFGSVNIDSVNKSDSTDLTTLHISPTMCEFMLYGVTPTDFFDSQGKGTFLENKYLQAQVDNDGCLILTLKNETISEWKNTFTALQVLQCVFGDARNIGITIDYSKDFMHYMEDAHTCGYEISEDYTKVIESPEDNSWYFPIINAACAIMQVFEGKTCKEVRVEHIEINDQGEVIETFIFPDDVGTDNNKE